MRVWANAARPNQAHGPPVLTPQLSHEENV